MGVTFFVLTLRANMAMFTLSNTAPGTEVVRTGFLNTCLAIVIRNFVAGICFIATFAADFEFFMGMISFDFYFIIV